MQLKKITDLGKAGNIYSGQSEILTIRWKDGINDEFFAFDRTKKIRQVDQKYFALNTIGDNYEQIEKQLPSKIHTYQKTNGLNGEIFFCTYREDVIHGFNNKGRKFYE